MEPSGKNWVVYPGRRKVKVDAELRVQGEERSIINKTIGLKVIVTIATHVWIWS